MSGPPTHPADYDEKGKRIACRGTLLQKEKGALMGSSWKKRYAYCDESKLLVWRGDKPTSKSSKDFEATNPKCGFVISECTFEESSERRYAFRVTDDESRDNITLAAEDARQYEAWHELFSRRRIQAAVSQQREARGLEAQAKKDEEQAKVKILSRDADLIREYFRKRDLNASESNPAILAGELQDLMNTLDPDVSELAARVALLELKIDPSSGSVTHAEFGQWWKAYCAETRKLPPAAEQEKRTSNVSAAAVVAAAASAHAATIVPVDCTTRLHFATFLDAQLATTCTLRRDLLAAPLPSIRYTPIQHPTILESDNWNDVYQRLVERACAAFVLEPYTTREEAMRAEAEAARAEQAKQRGRGPGARGRDDASVSLASEEPLEPHFTARFVTPVESIAACRSLAQFQGEFIKEALVGARLIVDEYVLPAAEKTKGVITLSMEAESLRGAFDRALRVGAVQQDDGREKADAAAEEVFGYGGLLYRVAAVAASEKDTAPSADRSRYLCGADDLFHKLAGNEHRHMLAVQRAISRVHGDYSRDALEARETEAVLVDRDDHDPVAPTRGKKGAAAPPPPQEATVKLYPRSTKDALARGERLHRPCTLLSAVIDYGGFRVTALCPTDIDETSTLVHGFSPAAGIFVDAQPESGAMLARVAAALNVSLERRVVNTVPTLYAPSAAGRANDNDGSQAEEEHDSYAPPAPQPCEVDVFSRELQVHECRSLDERLYLVNLRGLMPSDLPRPQTNDLLTHALRPEFVAGHVCPLAPEALRSVNEDAIGDDGEARFCGDAPAFAEEYLSPHAHEVLSAVSQLYTDRLPALARALDELTVLPVDSYTLASCFHLHGASMRQLGVVYALCTHSFAQQALLAEAVARCCKVLLFKALRGRWRQSKGASLLAEARGHSARADFVALNKEALTSRREAVLEIFNLALGSGPAAKQFWRSILADLAFQKFSLELPDCDKLDKSLVLHLPQLSAALQYHTGTILRDGADYDYSPIQEAPVRPEDLLGGHDCLLPAVKMPSVVPGEVGARLAQAEALLGAELYPEAASALRLRLHLQTLQSGDSSLPRHAAAVCDTIYKIALAQHGAGDYAGAIETISTCLASRHRFSALSARLVTLLMSAQFRSGDVAAALASFEDGQVRYLCALGDKHPAVCLHLCALGDCYHAAGHAQQALVMTTLAHQAAKGLLGDGHLLTASYGIKCAVLAMVLSPRLASDPLAAGASAAATEQEYIRSTLQESLRALDSAAQRGASLQAELAYCLHASAACESSPSELEASAGYASRCLALLQAAHPGPYQPPAALSCLLTLAEAKAKRLDVDGAVRVYESCWAAVRLRPTDFPHASSTLALLGCRLFDTLLHSLPLPTRSLLVAVAQEVTEGLHGGSREWEAACTVVVKVLWEGGARHFFQTCVDGLIQSEIDAGGGTVEPGGAAESKGLGKSAAAGAAGGGAAEAKPQRRGSNLSAAAQANFQSRALEVAVLLRLVEAPSVVGVL